MEPKKNDIDIERRKDKRVYASFVEYCRVEDESSKLFVTDSATSALRIMGGNRP